MLYPIVRYLLFKCTPELSHCIALNALTILNHLKLSKFIFDAPVKTSKTCMGLIFPNVVGLAAGLDKNGEYIDALAALGFGFIEVGTVTPRPQPGNAKPRIFRLPKHQALINRLGFNNKGVDYLITKITQANFKGILGINIGKNSDTPLESAIDDYQYCFHRAAPFASYIAINISSPNTKNLRDLQHGELLSNLLTTLKMDQTTFYQQHGKYLPLLVKISPDINMFTLKQIAAAVIQAKIDGVITCNTTLSRKKIPQSPLACETGGLSGQPLYLRSTAVTKALRKLLPPEITIIATGGICSLKQAQQKLKSGADLVQIYTGFIYHGPWWLNQLIQAL